MIHDEYNPEHCEGCHRDCGSCQDAYYGDRLIHPRPLFHPFREFNNRLVTRYAQRKVKDELGELAAAQMADAKEVAK